MKVLAIIPARGGSKGVPGKNIMAIDGKPLIRYTIEAALNSQRLTSIWVSSDDEDILYLSKGLGVNCHHRPAELATDTSPVTETLKEVLKIASFDKGDDFDAIMILQPTSPIRTAENIDQAIACLERSPKTNSVISVCAMSDIHPARMYWMKDQTLAPILEEFEQTRRQDIPPAFYRNGSIYLVRKAAFEKENAVMVKPSIGYEMPLSHLLNIDDRRDVVIAEALIPAWKRGELE